MAMGAAPEMPMELELSGSSSFCDSRNLRALLGGGSSMLASINASREARSSLFGTGGEAEDTVGPFVSGIIADAVHDAKLLGLNGFEPAGGSWDNAFVRGL